MTDISFMGGSIRGEVTPPPSKSMTHRAIILAALSRGRCRISNPLPSDDTEATIDAMRSIGATISAYDDGLEVCSDRLHAPEGIVDVGNSGTTLRLLTGILSTFDSEVTLTGDDSILRRPMGDLLDALSANGVACTSNDGKPPITVKGPLIGGQVEICGDTSSQFVSSLMISAPLAQSPMEIIVKGRRVSKPYSDITFSMMRDFGATITQTDRGYSVGCAPYVPRDYVIPSDYSSSAFPLVAGALGGEVTVCGMDPDSRQGDMRIIEILRDSGAEILISNDTVTCRRTGRPRAMDVDVSDIPDLFPIVSVLLSTADGESRLYGAPHLRFKESDRIRRTVDMISTLGGFATGTDDGCTIVGVERLGGGRIEHGGDHRIMMSAAIASLICDGPVRMVDDACWNVSYPGFVDEMRNIGLRCDRCTP